MQRKDLIVRHRPVIDRDIPASDADIEETIQRCRKMVTRRALFCAGVSALPLPGVDIAIDAAMMAAIMDSINREFGLTPEQIKLLRTEQRLSLFNLIAVTGSAWAGKIMSGPLIAAVLKKISVQLTATQAARWFPILGTATAAGVSFAALKWISGEHIKDCAEIARLWNARSNEG